MTRRWLHGVMLIVFTIVGVIIGLFWFFVCIAAVALIFALFGAPELLALLLMFLAAWLPGLTPEEDLQRVNRALASAEPVIFMAVPADLLSPFEETTGRWMPAMTGFENSPRGKNLTVFLVPLEVLAKALQTPALGDRGCVTLFVKNRTEGLLYYSGYCAVGAETYELGASWLEGAPVPDHIPESFKMTPVVVRTGK
jgi:hypothetical protein